MLRPPLTRGPRGASASDFARTAFAMLTLLLVLVAGPATESASAGAAAPVKKKQKLDSGKACFGAAARAPGRRCSTTSRAVQPTPDDALITPNVGCLPPVGTGAGFEQCSYGEPQATAVSTAALLGDSHASHWRGAIEAVGLARKWRVYEFARPHCPFTLAVPDQAYSDFCFSYNREMLAHLAAHPEIETVFVSVNHFVNVVVPPGETKASAKQAGHVAAIQALPASVKHVIVIRDPPQDRVDTGDCVREAIEAKRPAGTACAVPRKRAMRDDLQVAAARQIGPPRVNVVDFTRFFCSARVCYPVVGGVLVHKDQDHLGKLFVKTLAPFLVERTNAFVPLAPVS